MTYVILKYAHILGAILIGAGLVGVWMSDLRSRQLRNLDAFAEAVRNIAVFYDGVVVPGALILLVSGAWMCRSQRRHKDPSLECFVLTADTLLV